MRRQAIKIFGPPGTGKTTRLLNIVEDAIASGTRPERIAFLAFTKRAAQEAIDRAKARFNLADEQLPWFRTIHSMAFRDVSASRDDIMQQEHYREMGRIQGFRFTDLDQEMFQPMGTAIGDRLARIEHLSRLRKVPLEQQWRDSKFDDVPFPAVIQWVKALAIYKQSRGLIDYTDLLEQFKSEIDVDIVIIDEAQDLSLLQWDVISKAARRAKQIYFAGDDDQCIYGWAGADVNYFLRIRAEIEVLPVSFRLPKAIQRLATGVTDNIAIRQPKQWESRDDKGLVEWLPRESALDLRKGKWLLISRNHQFLKRFEKVCEDNGYPYMKEDRHSTNTAETKAILAWESWRKGGSIKQPELKQIKALLPALADWHPRGEVTMKEAPLPAAVKKLTWMDALAVTPRHREYVRACLSNRESLTAEPRIIVSTVHKVKGAEADHVALITDLTDRPWRQLAEDEEMRVLYVALTRARHSLHIIRPQSGRYYNL